VMIQSGLGVLSLVHVCVRDDQQHRVG